MRSVIAVWSHASPDRWCLVALLLALGPGCTRPSGGGDEHRLRQELSVPDGAVLMTLTAQPGGNGTFGREGLRIYAVFKLTRDEAQAYRAGFRRDEWLTLPVSDRLLTLVDGPAELSRFTANGVYLCDVAPWANQGEPPWQYAKEENFPKRLARYRLALLDMANSQLHIVYKQYY